MLTDQGLLILGTVVFGLLVIGLALTIMEFKQNILLAEKKESLDRDDWQGHAGQTGVAEDRC